MNTHNSIVFNFSVIIKIIIIIRDQSKSPEAFFFLDTKKCLFHLDLFTAIFLISVSSSAFSSGRRWDELCCRYVLASAPGRRDDITLDSYMTKRLMDSSLGMWIQWPMSLNCRSRDGIWLIRRETKSLVCNMVSWLFYIQHNPAACPCKDITFFGKCFGK